MKMCIDELNSANKRLDDTEDLRRQLPSRLKHVELKQLEEVYCKIVAGLKQRQFFRYQAEFVRTVSECKFRNLWKKELKIKTYPAFLIGRSPVDLFVPAIENGIVFEIDGSIHDHEWKSIKSSRHEVQLKKIGIPVFRIPNENVNSVHTREIIHKFKKLRLNDTRARRRIFRRIYIETIGTWVPEEKIHDLISANGGVKL